MKKESAIDWLIACLPPQNENKDYMEAIISQAKKMEKEQIINAYYNGFDNGREVSVGNDEEMIEAEDYFNNTYKK